MGVNESWRLGIIKELIVGQDGQTQAALIKVTNHTKLLRRSITHLIPVELQPEKDANPKQPTL